MTDTRTIVTKGRRPIACSQTYVSLEQKTVGTKPVNGEARTVFEVSWRETAAGWPLRYGS